MQLSRKGVTRTVPGKCINHSTCTAYKKVSFKILSLDIPFLLHNADVTGVHVLQK